MTDMSALDFDEQTALIVIDVQNDFADPRGSLYVDDGQSIIPTINSLVGDVRKAGGLVVYTQDWHPETTPHFQASGGAWPTHCVQGTWGAAIHPDLEVDGPVVRKGTGTDDGYSGFSARDVATGREKATELRMVLEEGAVRRLGVVGLAEDVCVQATALDARHLGYDTTVLLDATRPVNKCPGDDRRAIFAMAAAGVCVR